MRSRAKLQAGMTVIEKIWAFNIHSQWGHFNGEKTVRPQCYTHGKASVIPNNKMREKTTVHRRLLFPTRRRQGNGCYPISSGSHGKVVRWFLIAAKLIELTGTPTIQSTKNNAGSSWEESICNSISNLPHLHILKQLSEHHIVGKHGGSVILLMVY